VSRAWPAVLLASAAAVGAGIVLGGESSVRTLLVAWFLTVCPGMAVVRAGRLAEGWGAFMLAVGLSVATGLLASGALLYVGWFSSTGVYFMLTGVTVAGVATEVWRAVRAEVAA